MKMRVLFVDDQPNVLSGLSRMLRSLRGEWDMQFAESGDKALALMAESTFDVIVTDMRMSGMDGANLLFEVRERYPDTVRIVLSGQADQASVMRSVLPAHQYLTKPCKASTLKTTVARACSLRATLSQESLKRLVSQVIALPSLPDVYTKTLEELQSDEPSVKRVAELISRDIGISAKLLQLVNSSFFGLPQHVKSPAHAAALLGLNVLKPLVLSAGVFSQYDGADLSEYSLSALMEHCLAVSRLAEQIALTHSENAELAEDAFLAGIVHDVGQLLLATNLQEKYAEILTFARENNLSLCDTETECLGASHAEVGAYLLGLWGLADPIVEAVAFHHHPIKCKDDSFSPLTAVHVANILVNELQSPSAITYCLEMDVDYLERIGVANQVKKWRDLAIDSVAAGV